jgi:hypothetical protein
MMLCDVLSIADLLGSMREGVALEEPPRMYCKRSVMAIVHELLVHLSVAGALSVDPVAKTLTAELKGHRRKSL